MSTETTRAWLARELARAIWPNDPRAVDIHAPKFAPILTEKLKPVMAALKEMHPHQGLCNINGNWQNEAMRHIEKCHQCEREQVLALVSRLVGEE